MRGHGHDAVAGDADIVGRQRHLRVPDAVPGVADPGADHRQIAGLGVDLAAGCRDDSQEAKDRKCSAHESCVLR